VSSLLVIGLLACWLPADGPVAVTTELSDWPVLGPEAELRPAVFRTNLPLLAGRAGIRFFKRYISPLDGPRCAFLPSCSAYSFACLTKRGPWRGFLLSCDRLMRCHGAASGYPLRNGLFVDPAPD
jgi:putative membrane protein insertion efficiency factor